MWKWREKEKEKKTEVALSNSDWTCSFWETTSRSEMNLRVTDGKKRHSGSHEVALFGCWMAIERQQRRNEPNSLLFSFIPPSSTYFSLNIRVHWSSHFTFFLSRSNSNQPAPARVHSTRQKQRQAQKTSPEKCKKCNTAGTGKGRQECEPVTLAEEL